MFFLLYKTYRWQRFWWFSEDFRPLSEDFRRFSKIVPKARRTFPNIFREFPKISEDVRRLPKTFEEDPKMFRLYTNEFKYNLRDKLDITEVIDIFTCEDIISSHVRISYRFYQFVTTLYTTDFYIINQCNRRVSGREQARARAGSWNIRWKTVFLVGRYVYCA